MRSVAWSVGRGSLAMRWPSLGADAGYASRASYAQLEQLKTVALIPPQPGAKHPAAEAARARMQTAAGRDTAIDRQTHAEGAIAELKHHGLGRRDAAAPARCSFSC
jgi:hypothetical protein